PGSAPLSRSSHPPPYTCERYPSLVPPFRLSSLWLSRPCTRQRLLPLPPLKQAIHTTPLGLGALPHIGGGSSSSVRQPVVIVTRRGARTPLLPSSSTLAVCAS